MREARGSDAMAEQPRDHRLQQNADEHAQHGLGLVAEPAVRTTTVASLTPGDRLCGHLQTVERTLDGGQRCGLLVQPMVDVLE